MGCSEKWFVYEWSDTAGEPNIIAWCSSRKDAERELKSAVALARKHLAFSTEYALCHIEKEVEITKKET